MRQKILLILVLLNLFSKTHAQVIYQTGNANYTIPMFEWQDDKSRLSGSVTLNYNSGNGMKVNDLSSNVGQGWHLQIGGYIGRLQIGEPDDQIPREGSVEDIYKYPPGYLYDPNSAGSGCPVELTYYPIFRDKDHIYKNHNLVVADKELDQFVFEINGRSGVFVLGKNNGNKGIVLGDSKLKISYTTNSAIPNTRTSINAFTIQDENGVLYKFTKLSVTKVLKKSFSDPSGNVPWTQPKMEPDHVYYESGFDLGYPNPYVVTGWYMTEVEDVLTHRKILLNYEDNTVDAKGGATITYTGETGYSIVSHNVSKSITPEIKNISYPDGHEVFVNYGTAPRIDLPGTYPIESIDIKYDNRYISKYELKTAYFILNRFGNPETPFQKRMARLGLQAVHKVGIDLKTDEVPYNFEYYMGSDVSPDDVIAPPFSINTDIWGFYNGNNTKNYNNQSIDVRSDFQSLDFQSIKGLSFLRQGDNLVINQSVKENYAKNGLLKKVKYPGGGSLTYEYQQNEGQINNSNTMLGGVHVSKTIASDEGNNYDCEVSTTETNLNYTLEGTSKSSMWGAEAPFNHIVSSSYYNPEVKKYKWGFRHGCFPFGCCKYRYQYPGILSRDQIYDLSGREKFLESFSIVMDIISDISIIVDVINLVFISTGPGAIIAVVVDILYGLYTLIKSCTKDFSKTNISTVFYHNNLNNNQLPSQYKRVEIIDKNGQNGQTVMEFTSSDDYPIWENTNPVMSMKQRYANWAYGLPKKTIVYDASGNKVKETENVYDFQFAKRDIIDQQLVNIPGGDGVNTVNVNLPSCKCLIKHSNSRRSDVWVSQNAPNSFITNTNLYFLWADIYNIKSGRTELRSKYERLFKQGTSEYIQTQTDYSYSVNNFLPNLIRSKESNGDILQKSTIFTADANSVYGTNAGILTQLASNNLVNLPVETRSVLIKAASGIAYDLSETFTEFQTIPNGDIKPVSIKEHRYDQPTVVGNATNYYAGPLASSNNSIPFKTTQKFDYYSNGNLYTQEDEGHRSVRNMYDYNDKFIVASVINYREIKPDLVYTSFETSNMGNWSITGPLNYTATSTVTGKRALVIDGANNITTLSPFNNGIVSLWATVPVNVSNAALVKSSPTINGFTYFEYRIINGASPFNITGNATIDELRHYPNDARMRTATYDPLLGKTSECDENNRITYYEYDEKGRKRFIKDQDRNIVKMFEYNEAVKKANSLCPPQIINYSNLEVTETFIKEGCRPGESIGSSVPYTVPAGMFNSTISQAVVDYLVQNYLLTNGQNNANMFGECLTIYKNAAVSQSFQTEDCPLGYIGANITYAVPYGTYTSTISLQAANALAQEDILANGQAYANNPAHAQCVIDYDPDWEGTGSTQCGYPGANPPIPANHIAVQVQDINPNSPSYNTIQWSDGGLSADCGANVPVDMDITFTNSGNKQATAVFTSLSGGQNYSLNLAPNTTTSTVAGYIMSGNYTVTITVPFGSNAHTIKVFNTTQQAPFNQTPVTFSLPLPANAIIQITQ